MWEHDKNPRQSLPGSAEGIQWGMEAAREWAAPLNSGSCFQQSEHVIYLVMLSYCVKSLRQIPHPK